MSWLRIIADPEYKADQLVTELPERRPRPMPAGTWVTENCSVGDDLYLNIIDPADQELAEALLFEWGVPFTHEEPPRAPAKETPGDSGI